MKTYSRLEKPDLTRQLIASGHLPANASDADEDLVMEQSPVAPHTRLIDLPGGQTGVVVDLIIRNPLTGRPIRLDLQKFRIEVPWCPIIWLKKPQPLDIPRWARMRAKRPGQPLYSFPGPEPLAFAKDEALNHPLGRGWVLLPGDELTGPLMGIGERPLLDRFHDRERFTTCLSAFYGRGKRCDVQVDLMVEREAKIIKTYKVKK